MTTLEMYKTLSEQDRKNLTVYSIYNSIYTVAKNNSYELTDDEVERIKELSNYTYLKDEYYNLSSVRISDFLTECYVKQNVSLDKLESVDWNDILDAVDNNNYEFCNKNEIER
ncbi:MAG: hypothetical protein HFI86_06505 [Bacilli bacterium]|nr:hypothetical protein [Bacilli bacterium]